MARAVAVIGDSWCLLILRELFLGSRRFETIREQTGISPQLLSQRLKDLLTEGVIQRTTYSERPARHEFSLTAKGLDLWPVLIMLKDWGDRHLTDDHDGYLLELTHKGCGHVGNPQLACAACNTPVSPMDMSARMSTAMIDDRAARAEANSQASSRSRRIKSATA